MRITAYIIETHMFMWLPALCPPVVIITAGSGTDWGSEAQLCTLDRQDCGSVQGAQSSRDPAHDDWNGCLDRLEITRLTLQMSVIQRASAD